MKLPDLTISDVAKEIRKRREDVVKLITSGALKGYDVTPPGAKRKSYYHRLSVVRRARQTGTPNDTDANQYSDFCGRPRFH